MKSYAIQLSGIKKKYSLYRKQNPTFFSQLSSSFQKKDAFFYALDDISLEIKRGERIGIIGPNGAGKTTLLKIITGVTEPSSGSVKVDGKIVSLIDLSGGFQLDLSGRDNIYLNGSLIGMSFDEIDYNYHSIVSFAEVEDFIESPVYSYSDGMKLRLGFSIAAHSKPDILLMDEGFGAGDYSFQKKIKTYLNSKLNNKKLTLVLVSHWIEKVFELTDRQIVIQSGKKYKEFVTKSSLQKWLKSEGVNVVLK